jgi:hypothetical protein
MMITLRNLNGWRVARAVGVGSLVLSAVACGRVDDLLNVSPPANIQTADALDNRRGAEAMLASGQAQLETILVAPGNVYYAGG